jgi:hypothetical protein
VVTTAAWPLADGWSWLPEVTFSFGRPVIFVMENVDCIGTELDVRSLYPPTLGKDHHRVPVLPTALDVAVRPSADAASTARQEAVYVDSRADVLVARRAGCEPF